MSETKIIAAMKAMRRTFKNAGKRDAFYADGEHDEIKFDGRINLRRLAEVALRAAERCEIP